MSKIQIKNPKTNRYIKIDREKGSIVDHKKSNGPYKNILIVRNKRGKMDNTKQEFIKILRDEFNEIVKTEEENYIPHILIDVIRKFSVMLVLSCEEESNRFKIIKFLHDLVDRVSDMAYQFKKLN